MKSADRAILGLPSREEVERSLEALNALKRYYDLSTPTSTPVAPVAPTPVAPTPVASPTPITTAPAVTTSTKSQRIIDLLALHHQPMTSRELARVVHAEYKAKGLSFDLALTTKQTRDLLGYLAKRGHVTCDRAGEEAMWYLTSTAHASIAVPKTELPKPARPAFIAAEERVDPHDPDWFLIPGLASAARYDKTYGLDRESYFSLQRKGRIHLKIRYEDGAYFASHSEITRVFNNDAPQTVSSFRPPGVDKAINPAAPAPTPKTDVEAKVDVDEAKVVWPFEYPPKTTEEAIYWALRLHKEVSSSEIRSLVRKKFPHIVDSLIPTRVGNYAREGVRVSRVGYEPNYRYSLIAGSEPHWAFKAQRKRLHRDEPARLTVIKIMANLGRTATVNEIAIEFKQRVGDDRPIAMVRALVNVSLLSLERGEGQVYPGVMIVRNGDNTWGIILEDGVDVNTLSE